MGKGRADKRPAHFHTGSARRCEDAARARG